MLIKFVWYKYLISEIGQVENSKKTRPFDEAYLAYTNGGILRLNFTKICIDQITYFYQIIISDCHQDLENQYSFKYSFSIILNKQSSLLKSVFNQLHLTTCKYTVSESLHCDCALTTWLDWWGSSYCCIYYYHG